MKKKLNTNILFKQTKNYFMFLGLFSFFTANSQVVTTFAGSGSVGSINATGVAASFHNPSGVCSDALGNIYVADNLNRIIRKISPAGIVSTFAGSGISGSTDATGVLASFNSPEDICIDASGNLYVTDTYNYKIRKITPTGIVTTFAGSGSIGSNDATGVLASFNIAIGISADASDNIYVADWGNHKIRKISPLGVVTTYAGSGALGSKDTLGAFATFQNPFDVCADALGNIYVTDPFNKTIRKISPTTVVSTFAGSGVTGSSDGVGIAASFNAPAGICCDISGNIYVADNLNNKIRKITSAGVVSTFAGSGVSGSKDSIGIFATFQKPLDVCVDPFGNIFVADEINHKIRKITTSLNSVSNLTNQQPLLSIFPNPSKGKINIDFSSPTDNYKLFVYSILGEILYSKSIKEQLSSINLDLASGVYFISLDNNVNKITKKIIIE